MEKEKKYIILDVGKAYEYDEFKQLYDTSIYHILYIGEQYFIDDIRANVKSDNVDYWSYERLYSFSDYAFSESEKHNLTKVVEFVDNEKLTTEIYDRTLSNYLFNYSTRNDVSIIKMTIAAYRFVANYHPSFMLLYECSHNIRSWVVAKVCEFFDIPVRYCRNHVFLWRNVLLEGMKRNPKLLGDEIVNDHYSDWEYSMFKEIESRYEKGTEAIKPEYLEVMKEKKMKKLYSPWKDFKSDWKHPHKCLYKYRCYRAYEKTCSLDIPEKYIVFYLHLQPERTTLPEGYGFTQQYKAISLLSELIPEDWKIVVKEHPATFYWYCTPSGRWPGFYRDLVSIPKVVMVPLETDTYKLMGGSKAVSTITGTVGHEALMMGKPAILFGVDNFWGEKPKGIYFYHDDESLHNFISELDHFRAAEIKTSFDEYIRNEMMNTGTLGITCDDKWENSFGMIDRSNASSRLKLMKYILSQ